MRHVVGITTYNCVSVWAAPHAAEKAAKMQIETTIANFRPRMSLILAQILSRPVYCVKFETKDTSYDEAYQNM